MEQYNAWWKVIPKRQCAKAFSKCEYDIILQKLKYNIMCKLYLVVTGHKNNYCDFWRAAEQCELM